MAINEILPDGNTDFSGGQNASVSPNSLGENQYAYSVNMSTQRMSLTPRWGITELPLDWSSAGDYTRPTGVKVSFEKVFKSGKQQGFIPYSIGPDKYNIYIVSGFLFMINLSDFSVRVLNPTDAVNMHADRVNWSNAGQYLVVYDFPNRPFILDGIAISRADASLYEVPTSVLGTYNQNRLCIANANIDWTAGDPVGSTYATRAPVTFEEIILSNSPYVGEVYQVPTANKNNDVITAMGFLQVLDTSMGIGPLLVATSKAIYSYRTDQPRATWQGGTTSAVFGSAVLYNEGIVGQRAHTNVGGDIIFVSADGQVRTLTMARNEIARWSNTPISKEVNNFLIYPDPALMNVSVVSHFLNKIFVTCNPYRVECTSADGFPQTDYVNAGVVVLELDNISGLTTKVPPVWAGMWTGVQFTDFANNGGIMYIAGKDKGENKMFMFDPSRTYDTIDGKVRYVRSLLLTREYTHTDQTVNKELQSLDLGLREMEEKVTVKVDYKPSTSGTYVHWKDLAFNTPVEQCNTSGLKPQGLLKRGVRDLTIGSVNETVCDPASRDYMHVFKGVQLRMEITGKAWELEYIKLKARVLPQIEIEPYCGEQAGVEVPAQCFDVWYVPENNDC